MDPITLADVQDLVLQPTTDETRRAFKVTPVEPSDHLHVGLSPDGRTFHVRATKTKSRPDSITGSASYEAANGWVKDVPERKKIEGRYGAWDLAATDYTSLIIHAKWPKDQVTFSHEASVVHAYNLGRLMLMQSSARQVADFKINGVVPPLPDDYTPPEGVTLSPFQACALSASINRPCFATLWEQGTGKTLSVISRVDVEAKRRGRSAMYRALVVCPKNVRTNWCHEFARFSTVPGVVTPIRGGAVQRLECIARALAPREHKPDYTVMVCSYESACKLLDVFSLCQFDLIVLDESQFIKSPYTKRTKDMLKLRDMAQQRMILTGTPVGNSYFDLWAQLEFLDQGLSGFNDFREFRSFYGKFSDDGGPGGVQRLIGYKNMPVLQERLALVSFMLTKDEAGLHLPPIAYDIHEVEMTPKQAQMYSELAETMLLEIQGMLDDATASDTLTVNHILTKLLRLAQITSGHVRWDDGRVQQVNPDGENPKTIAVLEDIQALPANEKAIVWCTFIPDVLEVKRALDAAGIKSVTYYGATNDHDRDEAVRLFNEDPTVRVFVGNPSAGGVGLNLLGYPPGSDGTDADTGTNVTLNGVFSQDWSALKRSQSESRSHRRGTRVQVRCVDYVVPGTIDEEIRSRVVEKRIMAHKLTDIRDILTSIATPRVRDED